MVEAIKSAQSIDQTIKGGEGQAPSPPPYSETRKDVAANVIIGSGRNQGVDELLLGQETKRSQAEPVERPTGVAAGERPEGLQAGQHREQLQELEEKLEALNKKMDQMNREVHFLIDKKINKQYISIIDRETKDVIKEFPPQEIRNFIAALQEFMDSLEKGSEPVSLLVDREV